MILFYLLLHVCWAYAAVISLPSPAIDLLGNFSSSNGNLNSSDSLEDWSPACVNTTQYPDWAGDMDYNACAYAIGEQCMPATGGVP